MNFSYAHDILLYNSVKNIDLSPLITYVLSTWPLPQPSLRKSKDDRVPCTSGAEKKKAHMEIERR
jgi:hypothetical protein